MGSSESSDDYVTKVECLIRKGYDRMDSALRRLSLLQVVQWWEGPPATSKPTMIPRIRDTVVEHDL